VKVYHDQAGTLSLGATFTSARVSSAGRIYRESLGVTLFMLDLERFIVSVWGEVDWIRLFSAVTGQYFATNSRTSPSTSFTGEDPHDLYKRGITVSTQFQCCFRRCDLS